MKKKVKKKVKKKLGKYDPIKTNLLKMLKNLQQIGGTLEDGIKLIEDKDFESLDIEKAKSSYVWFLKLAPKRMNITTGVSKLWKTLGDEEKQFYVDKSEEDKQRYKKEINKKICEWSKH